MNIPNSHVILITLAGLCALAPTLRAQNAVASVPTPPATKLETLETNTGTILIKATALIGSISVNGATVSVTCKEDTETGTGRKEYGIVIGLASVQTTNVEDRTIVDYDELGSLVNAMDVLARIDSSVTSLTSFDATYQTTGGFRVAAFSVRRLGIVELSVRSSRMSKGIVLTQSQLTGFRGLIDQAKHKIDDLRAK
jgi:hypothetical protein